MNQGARDENRRMHERRVEEGIQRIVKLLQRLPEPEPKKAGEPTDDAEFRRVVLAELQQRLQPDGSPPPGGATALAVWIIRSAAERLRAGERE